MSRRWVTATSLKHSFAIFRRPSLDGYQRQIPSVPPSGEPPDRGSPAALSERSEFSGRPGWWFGGREARRAGAAGRISLDTFLLRSKKVSRPPGRDPAASVTIAAAIFRTPQRLDCQVASSGDPALRAPIAALLAKTRKVIGNEGLIQQRLSVFPPDLPPMPDTVLRCRH